MKKLFSVIISLCIFAMMLPMGVFADSSALPEYSGGSGTQSDPYLISSVDDLLALAEAVNTGKTVDVENPVGSGIGNYYGMYFKQTQDIDLAGVAWEPIGYSTSCYFSGHYDGGNNTIVSISSNGKICDPADEAMVSGLFGFIAFGSVSNLHINNARITCNSTDVSLQSFAGGLSAYLYNASIKNCSVIDSQISATWTRRNYTFAGGIIGYADDVDGSTPVIMEKVASKRNTITGTTDAALGGLVGSASLWNGANYVVKDSYIADCSMVIQCDVVGTNSAKIGGIVGDLDAPFSVENVFVYNVSPAQKADDQYRSEEGVFIGYDWGYYTTNWNNTYYYTTFGDEEKGDIGTSIAKTPEEFAADAMATALGDAFIYIDGNDYPVLKTAPADYSAVKEALGKVPSDLTGYTEESVQALNNVIAAVVSGKTVTEQNIVDGYAAAIEQALAGLTAKDTTGDDDNTGSEGGSTVHPTPPVYIPVYEPVVREDGWQKMGKGWYIYENNTRVKGWYKWDNVWYYLAPTNGRAYTEGIYEIDGEKYYFYDWCGMASAWWYEDENGDWFYFFGSGEMAVSEWVEWKGGWYYCGEDGKMLTDTTTPDGYSVNASGLWIA